MDSDHRPGARGEPMPSPRHSPTATLRLLRHSMTRTDTWVGIAGGKVRAGPQAGGGRVGGSGAEGWAGAGLINPRVGEGGGGGG